MLPITFLRISKIIRLSLLFIIIILILPAVFTATINLDPVKKASAEFSLTTEEIQLPENSYTTEIAVDSAGNIWFTNETQNKIGKILDHGAIVEYELSIPSHPHDIIISSDGNVWFTEIAANAIGKISPSGEISRIVLPNENSYPFKLAEGFNGDIWFTERLGNRIGRITSNNRIDEFSIPTSASYPYGIAKGLDGNMWFTEENARKVAKITSEGIISEFQVPRTGSTAKAITTGADGNVWFIEENYTNTNPAIGRITPDGSISEFFNIYSQPYDLVWGPEGMIWFTEGIGGKIGSITPNGNIVEYSSPEAGRGIAADSNGRLWYTGTSANKVIGVKISSISPTITPTPPSVGGVLNVPLLKQGIAPYTNGDPSWEIDEFDHANAGQFTCGKTMAQCGCATTSVAMVLNYYGILKLPDGTQLTPGTLNAWLKRPDVNGYNRNLGIKWGVAATVAKKAKAQNPSFAYNSLEYDQNTSYTATRLTNDLQSKIPNILQVNAPGMHFVVATGKSNNAFTINDPLFNKTSLSQYNDHAVSVRRYVPANSDMSYITYEVDESVDIEVTDEDGNIVGESYIEYSPAQLTEEPYNIESSAIKVYSFAKPNTGIYTVKLSSPTATSYQLDETLITQEGDVKTQTFKGFVSPISSAEFNISFDKQFVENSTTEELVTFAKLKADLKSLYEQGQIKNKLVYNTLKFQAELAEKASQSSQQPLGNKLAILTLKIFQFELNKVRKKAVTENAYQILYKDADALIKNLQGDSGTPEPTPTPQSGGS